MKNIKTKLTAIIMTGFLMAGTAIAKDGMLLSDLRGGEQTCTQTDGGILTSDYTGTIISGIAGTIISGFTGTIISGIAGTIISGATDTKSACGK